MIAINTAASTCPLHIDCIGVLLPWPALLNHLTQLTTSAAARAAQQLMVFPAVLTAIRCVIHLSGGTAPLCSRADADPAKGSTLREGHIRYRRVVVVAVERREVDHHGSGHGDPADARKVAREHCGGRGRGKQAVFFSSRRLYRTEETETRTIAHLAWLPRSGVTAEECRLRRACSLGAVGCKCLGPVSRAS